MRKIFYGILFLLITFCALPVQGVLSATTEQIDNFDVEVRINQDSSLNVRENIKYNFGSGQKHGIYREIPIKYKVRGGNYNLRISDIKVKDEYGKPYNFEISYPSRYAKIKIGEANKFVSGFKIYIVEYTVKRAINYFSDYDELYWNATGNEWQAPIERATATVIFPSTIESKDIKKDCFVGEFGSNVQCYMNEQLSMSETAVTNISFSGDDLDLGEGLTIVAGFPKGIVAEPSELQLFTEIFKDNWVMLMPITIFLIMFSLYKRHGRDPSGRGTIVTQFDAPDNLTPAEVGTMIDEWVHQKDISATIIDLAIKGYLKINRIEGKGILKSADYELKKIKDGNDLKNDFEKKMMSDLFGDSGTEVKLSDLKNKFYKDLQEITRQIYQSTVSKNYFPKSPKTIRLRYIMVGAIAAFFDYMFWAMVGAIGGISIIISAAIIIIFGFFMPAKTQKGVLAKEHILGLKRYLSVAEKERIKFHNAPEKNPQLFEKLLPYAMVLGVEKQWAKQFEDIYKDQSPTWYGGFNAHHFSAYALTNDLAGFNVSAQSTLASTPASSGSSGFGGGGFSGGGFGGGGGGSW